MCFCIFRHLASDGHKVFLEEAQGLCYGSTFPCRAYFSMSCQTFHLPGRGKKLVIRNEEQFG